jgi:hypothetical protein
MTHNPSTGSRSGAFACAVLGILVAFVPWLEASAAPEPTDFASEQARTWLRDMGAYFDAHPELKTTPGSGWKPYNRRKWFLEQRMVNGQLPEPGARWEAWLRKKDIESRMPPARNTWFNLGPTNFAGRMLAIDFDPTNANIVYVGGADGGVWKSTDGGNSWTPISDELPSIAVGGIAVSKTNTNIVVIGTGEPTPSIDRVGGVGILRSTDAGATWVTTNLSYGVNSGHGFHHVEAGPNGTFLAGATDGLYRSSDDGATWNLIPSTVSGGDWYDIVWKPGDANRVYNVRGNASGGNSVKVSTDDGITWAKVGVGQPPSFNFGKCKLGVSGTTIYCYIGFAGTGGGIYGLIKSTDDGANWTDLGMSPGLPSGQTWYNLICAADPNNADRVICGAVDIARSGDGGLTFASVLGGIHVDQHCIKYEPGSNTNLWVGNDGGMYRNTADGGSLSWTGKNTGLVTYQFYDICVSNGPTYYIMGGTQDNGTDKWSGTTTWANGIGADGMVCNISPSSNNIVYGEIQFGDHRKSTNSGSTFTSINNGIFGTGAWVAPVALDPANASNVLTSTGSGIFRTVDGGANWSNVAAHTAVWIDYSLVNGNYAWTVGATPFYTTDNGTSWTMTSTFASSGITVAGGATKILADPADVNSAFVTFSGYNSSAHIVRTTDLGATWVDVSGDFSGQPVNAIAVDPSNPTHWYIGTDVGVWASVSGGTNWVPFETGFPNAVVVDLEIRDADRKLVAGTHGRGAWEVDIPPTATSAEVAVEASRNLMLDEPQPNPVADRTLLRYAAKSQAQVSLRIYDVQGRLVSDLVDAGPADGIIRTTPWFTDDVPSGVYFAVLQVGEERKSRKITVLR